MCMDFGDEILLSGGGGGRIKTREKFNFSEKMVKR